MEPKYKVNKFLNEIRLYLELYKKVKTKDPKDFERFVDDLLRRYNNGSQLSIEVMGAKDREAIIAINDQIKKDFSHFGEYIDDKISEILKEGIKKDIPRNELYSRASRELRKGRQYAYTWINTAENASNQAVMIRKNIEAGVKYFKYAGPPADREFCSHLLGNILSLNDIQSLDNGQGLPVLYYKGGYNCRHRWVPVDSDKLYKEDMKELIKSSTWAEAEKQIRDTDFILDKSKKQISGYTGGYIYHALNTQLWENRLNDFNKTYERLLKKQLNSIKPESGVFFRGQLLSQVDISRYKPGKIVQEQGFLSTSSDKSMAKMFGDEVKFIIFAKETFNIEKFSESRSEFERLVKSRTSFKVYKVVNNNGKYTIYLRQL
jgi:hypothetical protein